ncbi:MAG: ABC transporter ATP-binding protein [Streptococcaceae bacterium]|jgi:ABC-2 type transport system ATP-binding protein|nr:ABC transporter ATP-binding protein [Streptococcaceae bacterium]
MRTSLNIHSLCKSYQGGKIKANDQIDTTFHQGELVALVGHNGAGKTTFLKQIMGEIKSDQGSITFQGYSLNQEPQVARKFCSIMPQLKAPLTGVTMEQAIQAILRIRGLKNRESKEQTKAILKELKIADWRKLSGKQLSGGLQRLTSFAMTVASPTPILLLDEPTNDVDPIRRKLIWEKLRKLAQDGHIVIIVTHNLLEVERYADRYLLMDKGKVIQDVTLSSLSNKENMLTVYLNGEILEEITLPDLNYHYNELEQSIQFSLRDDEIISVLEWAIDGVKEKIFLHYKLGTRSLDDDYEELTENV